MALLNCRMNSSLSAGFLPVEPDTMTLPKDSYHDVVFKIVGKPKLERGIPTSEGEISRSGTLLSDTFEGFHEGFFKFFGSLFSKTDKNHLSQRGGFAQMLLQFLHHDVYCSLHRQSSDTCA